MSRVRNKDTQPELIVRRFLHAHGFRYRLHDKNLPGKPDITLKKYRTIVLIHGCFWHGHENCPKSRLPATNTAWWEAKITRSKIRDKELAKSLTSTGWKVQIIWECALKKDRITTLKNLISILAV